MAVPRSSPYLSFVYNNTDNAEHPIDWFGTEKDMQENEYFSYSYISDYIEEKSPNLHKELNEMFDAYKCMENIRKNSNDFYDTHFPALTPIVYKQMYQGICTRAIGMMMDFLGGKWEDFEEWCKKDDCVEYTIKKINEVDGNMVMISWDYKNETIDEKMSECYSNPSEKFASVLKEIISHYPNQEEGKILFKQNADGCFYATLVEHDSWTLSYRAFRGGFLFRKRASFMC